MQQPVRIKGVIDAATPGRIKTKTYISTALGNGGANLRLLLGRRAVFLRQVLGDVLPAGRHLRVQLKGLKVQLGAEHIAGLRQGLLQRSQADGAPGAGDIGNKVNFQGRDHVFYLSSFRARTRNPWSTWHCQKAWMPDQVRHDKRGNCHCGPRPAIQVLYGMDPGSSPG